MIRRAGMQIWDSQHAQGPLADTKWPLQDPNWNHQQQDHRINMQDLRGIIVQGIWEAVPRGQNINKAFNERQKKEETPTDWLERLRKNLQMYSGLDPETLLGQALLKTQFVAKSWEDIRKKLEKLDNWQDRDLDELLREAQKCRKVEYTPFSVIIKDPETPIRVKQYPISPEGKNGLKPEIERLLSKGLLESCMSPFNTPILPIKRQMDHTDEKSRDYLAFEWEDPVTHRRQQLRWTVLPQGFTESPNLFGQALEQILQEYQTGEGVTLIQYVDDLLIAGEAEDKVRAESIRLLNFLSAKGLKVSKAKLQFVEEEVKYLGHYLRNGEKKIDPERVKGILSIPPPKSKKQIRQLLGLMGYCREWIENYSTKVKFLYEKLSQGGLVKWDEKDDKHLKALRHDLVNAPVLSLPDLKRPFYLFVNTDSGTAYGVLTQEWAGKKKPVGYLSKLLDPVSRGWPTCLQALVACALLVEEANKITFNGELRVLSPHNIRGILQQKAEKWITDARLLKYEGILLDSPKLTLEVTALQNPAQFLYGRPSEDGLAHECLSTIEEQTKIRPDLDEEELEEGDRLFVDGSSRVINGKRVSGYAIVGGEGLAVFESGPLSGSWSAQACELYAVLWALQLLKDKSAEIVDCTCRTRLKGIRCDTFPVKYRNWDSYVKRQQSRPRDLLKNIPAAEKMVPPVARGNRVDGKGRGGLPIEMLKIATAFG
ncbi:hypothetical protein DUI87_34326 [Hirundo rustica rustica]|uniref:ribonuclease H n=1 Tax=Hirundo rustica rustica TaxID=333673 RepID=A0A3M0J3Y2_HIRRU|nr:hypothetical protein DUI87_34326 [Hirundo rustica rustica]